MQLTTVPSSCRATGRRPSPGVSRSIAGVRPSRWDLVREHGAVHVRELEVEDEQGDRASGSLPSASLPDVTCSFHALTGRRSIRRISGTLRCTHCRLNRFGTSKIAMEPTVPRSAVPSPRSTSDARWSRALYTWTDL